MRNRENFRMLPMYGEIPYIVKTPKEVLYFSGVYVVFLNKKKGNLLNFMTQSEWNRPLVSCPSFYNTNVYPVLKSLNHIKINEVSLLSFYQEKIHKRIGDDLYLKKIAFKLRKFKSLPMSDIQMLTLMKYDVFGFIAGGIGFNYEHKKIELNGNGIYL